MEQLSQDQVKEKILEEIKKTEAAIIDYKDASQPVAPENSIGRLSRMEAINSKSVMEAALRSAQDKLSKLHHMLSKVGHKDFGMCARCKNPIPIKRLLYMPQSSYCVNCAR